jgi:hypothetical protein
MRSIFVIDHMLLHDVSLMKVNVVDALHFIVELWWCHTTVGNCSQKCEFRLNQ